MSQKPNKTAPPFNPSPTETDEEVFVPRQETYYDTLKVSPDATIPEIVDAYHRAKSAFSQDSIATYSLFSENEIKELMQQLEQAYSTLTNIERRALYDQQLADGLPITQESQEAFTQTRTQGRSTQKETPASQTPPPQRPTPKRLAEVNGKVLKETREALGLNIEDVARTTKIPARYIKAIESDEFHVLPARVYLLGFITNIASHYQLDNKDTTKKYLEYFDTHAPKT